MAIPLSIIILTKNEEAFIRRCIQSVDWADEVVVLDSGSADATQEIATSCGAKVYQQAWLGWSEQHNLALSLAKNDWVFCLDSDEIVTPELAASILKAMQGPMNDKDGYYLDRRGDFLGILLPNESRLRKRQTFVRIFNRRYSAYDPVLKVHEEVIVSGNRLPLSGVLLHWRGYKMDEYIPVFNRYATVEAEVLHESGIRATTGTILLRPLLRFLWCYIYKKGYRLGAQGLIHAMLKATSEYIRYAKLWEMQNVKCDADPPPEVYSRNVSESLRSTPGSTHDFQH